jgi:ParB family chromosome partitioning protein
MLQQVARKVLIEVLSCRENRTNSGIVARVAGDTIGADGFLPNMGTDEFMSCLSRPALEASCKDTPVLPRARVKDTRAALAEHFKEGHFVHPWALFAPDVAELTSWTVRYASRDEDDEDIAPEVDELDGDLTEATVNEHPVDDGDAVEDTKAWRVAAE